ncbi:MAG: energy transducer TonB, partial [Gemmatimonadetes bacterium]|nr:energy transducer TonB [Gemmatimonadota bacterium]
HSALIAAAVGATRHPAPRVEDVVRDTVIVFPGSPDAPHAPTPPPAAPSAPSAPLVRLPVDVPPVIPAPEPMPITSTTFTPWPTASDTSRFPGPGSPGTPANVLAPAVPIDARIAEEPPLLLGHPAPHYPEMLRQAGIEGRVVVEVVLDTLGRAEPASLRVVSGAHPLFDAEASAVVLASRYRPARVGGRPVRVRILVPVGFSLRR